MLKFRFQSLKFKVSSAGLSRCAAIWKASKHLQKSFSK